jgi:UDP-N-acetylglucosamine--N-acetylmuramyl-(pentapeptide) pyrophosphoryl-undecaprenol N-acetylglucosamine transferase
VVQEQNSFAGITNKLLAKKAAKICVAYEGMEQFFPADKIKMTGNPVRADIIGKVEKLNDAYEFYGLDPSGTTLLVLGGSLGAGRINELIESKLGFFAGMGIQLIWQCGKLYDGRYGKYNSESVKVFGFLNRMDLAYAIADVIISRAGAGSVSELCIAGKPVIFIPSPNVSEDHQTKNAESLVKKEAALMIRERDLNTDFDALFTNLFQSPAQRQKLGRNIKLLAMPGATEKIVDEIEKLLKNQ